MDRLDQIRLDQIKQIIIQINKTHNKISKIIKTSKISKISKTSKISKISKISKTGKISKVSEISKIDRYIDRQIYRQINYTVVGC